MELELKNKLKELEAQTEHQKQLISWNGSTPQTNEYIKTVGIMRQGSLATLLPQIEKQNNYIEKNGSNLKKEELIRIKSILKRIKDMPTETDELYPYEIEILLEYNRFLDKLNILIESM